MEDEKEFKTETEVSGNSEPTEETGFNISEEFASSLPSPSPKSAAWQRSFLSGLMCLPPP